MALNCVGNGRILREGPFEDIWIQPAAGDAGGALGVALFIWHQLLGNAREAGRADSPVGLASWGRDSTTRRSGRFSTTARSTALRGTTRRPVAELIEHENVVGWMQGRMEFGPRALGSRSILGDARSPECSPS